MGGTRHASEPRREPPWAATAKIPEFSALGRDLEVDVCVVGAGISGLTTAYRMASEGRSVAVLDDGAIGTGMTGATTAHLTSILDDHFHVVERIHGEDRLRLTYGSHVDAIARIGAIVEAERIDCGYETLDGYLFVPPGGDPEELERELVAARKAGAEVARVQRVPWKKFDTGPALRFAEQAQIHPLRYLAGLARAIVRLDGRIFTETHADEIEDGRGARVVVGRHTIRCGAAVVATNSPVSSLVAMHLQQSPVMTYVVGLRIRRGAVPRAIYYDLDDPYHYVRLHSMSPLRGWANDELLIVGGEDHVTGRTDDTEGRHARLEAWARERFPAAGAVEFLWGGQVMEPADGLALIGRAPGARNVYVVTGDSGMGMTHGTIAGDLIGDLILGRDNRLAEIYDPARFRLRAAPRIAGEGIATVLQYLDWLTPGDRTTIEGIAPGSGAVLRRGLHKLAIHRDDEGDLHALSAVCTHLGCIVAWNEAEKSFDCPCHGSRFSATGEPINGPANRPLEPADLEEPVAAASAASAAQQPQRVRHHQ